MRRGRARYGGGDVGALELGHQGVGGSARVLRATRCSGPPFYRRKHGEHRAARGGSGGGGVARAMREVGDGGASS